jgi:type IV pilus assembly protein PilQ
VAEEKRLADARAKREAEEQKLADAEAKRKAAEADLQAAKAGADRAAKDRDAAAKDRDAALVAKEQAAKDAQRADDEARAAKDQAVRDREVAARDKDDAAKAKDAAAREKDAAAREKDAAAREKDAIAKEKDAVAREKDAVAKEKAENDNRRQETGTRQPAIIKKEKREPEPEVASEKVKVKDVDFQDRDDAARVLLVLSGAAKPKVIVSSGKQAILEVRGAELPTKLARALDTSDFGGPVVAVSSYQDPRDASKVRVVVDLSQPVSSQLVKTAANTWAWDFEKPVAMRKVKRAKTVTVAKSTSYDAPVMGGYGAATTPVVSQTVAQNRPRPRVIYRAQKIDLDFKDADIHNVLRLLAKLIDVNIVVPDEIKGTVSVRLSRVPADQALEVILASKGLWYRREGNVIRIALRKDLDAEDEEKAARAAAAVRAENPEPVVFTLNYTTADAAAKEIEHLRSGKGSIDVDTRTNSLIINDLKENRRRMLDLLTQLDTQTPEIQIEARIVEARSTWLREIGVQWGPGISIGGASGNPTGLIFPSSINLNGGSVDQQTQANGITGPSTQGIVGPPDFGVNLPAPAASGRGGAVSMLFGSVGGNFNIEMRLSAAEDLGTVRIVSAPKITTLNNIQADISQGVSIPISVVSAQGVQTQFVQANLELKVTPHVSQRDCSIQMSLEITKNEPDFVNVGARGDPTILTKKALTTMLVADAETTVIGGIYTRNTGYSTNRVPWLGELPFVGYFFRHRRQNDDRTELLIFVTPKITNKASLRCEANIPH